MNECEDLQRTNNSDFSMASLKVASKLRHLAVMQDSTACKHRKVHCISSTQKFYMLY